MSPEAFLHSRPEYCALGPPNWLFEGYPAHNQAIAFKFNQREVFFWISCSIFWVDVYFSPGLACYGYLWARDFWYKSFVFDWPRFLDSNQSRLILMIVDQRRLHFAESTHLQQELVWVWSWPFGSGACYPVPPEEQPLCLRSFSFKDDILFFFQRDELF